MVREDKQTVHDAETVRAQIVGSFGSRDRDDEYDYKADRSVVMR